MKNILTNLMTSAVLMVTLGVTLGAGLEAQTLRMQATIPFAWQAHGQQLNAGDYVVSRDAVTKVMTIAEKNGGKTLFLLTTPASDNIPSARLVFHCYGNQHFLAEVVTGDDAVTRLPVGAAEREASLSQPRQMSMVSVEVKSFVN